MNSLRERIREKAMLPVGCSVFFVINSNETVAKADDDKKGRTVIFLEDVERLLNEAADESPLHNMPLFIALRDLQPLELLDESNVRRVTDADIVKAWEDWFLKAFGRPAEEKPRLNTLDRVAASRVEEEGSR